MTARRVDELCVRRSHGGFALESPELYCWDEDPREVIQTAEAVRSAAVCGREREITYTIDRNDRITELGGCWSEFALRNGAPELRPELVIGRRIWSFIAGKQTQRLYEDAMYHVRHRGKQVEIPSRSDSPTHARWTRLILAPAPQGAVLTRSIIVHEAYRVFAPVLERSVRRGDQSLAICGLCNDCLLDSKWIGLEDLLARLGLGEDDEMPRLDPTVCTRCVDVFRREIQRAPIVRVPNRD